MSDPQPHRRPNFDPIASAYRWLEYAAFGRALERCRVRFVADVLGRSRALVLGDGDGRYLAHLLARDPDLRVDAVDTSASMLRHLRTRCTRASPTAAGLRTYTEDACSFEPTGLYDVIVTHFFLDCLSEADVRRLTRRLARSLAPDAVWVVSEFRIPPGAMRVPAALLVRLLYLAFRALAGLRTTSLPDYATALADIGLSVQKQQTSLLGILTSELWQRQPSVVARHPTLITAEEIP